LRAFEIINPHKTIVALLIADACSLQGASQILPTVQTDLNGHRQPGLQANVHPSKLGILIVKVDVQTLTLQAHQFQHSCLSPQIKRLAGLDTRQDADQAFADLVAFGDLTGDLLFRARGRIQIAVFAPSCLSHSLGMFFEASGNLLHKFSEVFVQNPLARQKSIQTTNVADAQHRATKQESIKTCYSTNDAVFVPLHKTLHFGPPVLGLFNPILPDNPRGALLIFGCGYAAL
jgi:hypothetical protein